MWGPYFEMKIRAENLGKNRKRFVTITDLMKAYDGTDKKIYEIS